MVAQFMMNRTAAGFCTASCCLALALAGCAGQARQREFLLTGTDRIDAVELLWPREDVPRYRYLGDLIGETNFHDAAGSRRRGLHRILAALAGLDYGRAQPVALQRPQAGMVDDHNRIFITDASRQAVFVFDQDSGNLQVWDQASAGMKFGSPVGIAAGAGGEILVADSVLGEIFRLDPAGNPVGGIGKDLLVRPTGLARDPDRGLIYVSDSGAHDIKVFDDRGGLVELIGNHGTLPGEFNSPTFLAHAGNRLYVADTLNARVQVLTEFGSAELQIGKRGLYVGEMTRPKGVAVDGDGNIYVVESYYDYLLVFNRDGRFLLPIGGGGSGPGEFFQPAGVWVDGNDRIFVADMLNGRVSVFQYLGDN